MNANANRNRSGVILTGLAVGLVMLGGAAALRYGNAVQAGAGSPAAQMQAPSVDVEILLPEPVQLWRTFSGRLEAVERVEVRPRVSGAIVEVLHGEGGRVKAGDPLYVIDPRPFEVAVASARAEVESARSRLEFARVELARVKGLENKRVVSRSHVDSVRNDYRVAEADLSAAQAALESAKLELDYAHIEAPVGGRISRAEVTRGNLVEAGANAPVLTTIVADDRLYAEFELDEQTYLDLARRGADTPIPVRLQLDGDIGTGVDGRLHAFDNEIDSRTGTIRARALVDNADGVLVPGMFVRVSVAAPGTEAALLIPERAVGTNQSRKFVYVVNADDRVTYREVELGAVVEGRRLVLSGLDAGDRVMVNSLQRVRPDMQVTPVDVNAVDAVAKAGKRDLVRL
ncbi:efflux RND transporter periplasmic adaptor subunit [Marinobacterium aestuariivivens]|uniref:Efflux RND transporter periplasmic adaptor subunit n=1 Tax=Marinobacterium aestuariivivens TaxID=1698799 RepID=A0ABW2A6W8_9GAMM